MRMMRFPLLVWPVISVNCHQLFADRLLSLSDQTMTLEKTLITYPNSPLCKLSLLNSHQLIFVWPEHETWENSRANSLFSILINSHLCWTRAWQLRKLSCKLLLISSHQSTSLLDQNMTVEKINSYANSLFLTHHLSPPFDQRVWQLKNNYCLVSLSCDWETSKEERIWKTPFWHSISTF